MEQQNISSDLIRGHIDTIILHTLLSGDKFAQQISDCIEEKSEKEYKINQATLYSSLKRLESLKFVQSYWNDSDNGRRKYFKLTESGKNTVESNLSNWSFSRAVIDKLMDCEQKTVYKTQYIEKIVEVPKEVIKEVIVEVPKAVSPTNSDNNLQANNIKTNEPPTKSNEVFAENTQEISFRNILNGLIKSTAVQHRNSLETLEPLNKEEKIEEKPATVQKFNETITSTDYNATQNNNGKIDFGDLSLKAIKEGYKIRISSKESCIAKGSILINKLNFISSLVTFIISICTLLLTSMFLLKNVDWKNIVTIICAVTFAIYPIFTAIKFAITPKATASNKITPNEIITTLIVVFNLILVTVSVNLLMGVNFESLSTIAVSMILPIIIFIMAVIYFVIRYFISKCKFVKSK